MSELYFEFDHQAVVGHAMSSAVSNATRPRKKKHPVGFAPPPLPAKAKPQARPRATAKKTAARSRTQSAPAQKKRRPRAR